MTSPREIAVRLLQATSMADEEVFPDRSPPMNTVVDYYRIACHVLFVCEMCGRCCKTGNPIRLRHNDIAIIARHLKIPVDKAVRKYTLPDPKKSGVLNLKKILPCRFYDPVRGGCKIYSARPWSCRIFPFIGTYGSPDQVKVHESCPGSVKAVKALTEAVESVQEESRSDPALMLPDDKEAVKKAKLWFKQILATVK